MTEDSTFDVDHHMRLGRADIRITHNSSADIWLVSRYPDQGQEGYPGFTYSSTEGQCPHGPDLDTMIAWARQRFSETS